MLDPRTPQVSPCDLPALGVMLANTPVPPSFWARTSDGSSDVGHVWRSNEEFTGK